MNNFKTPLVSIICPTYNHEHYIRQCLEGFINQIIDFELEIIVHDDASTDKTLEIVKEFEFNYPHVFNNIYQTDNQFSKDPSSVSRIMFAKAKGKYIAVCEGDDYWTDPYKLQKQVDFLEANTDYGLCFTKTKYLKNNVLELQELPIGRPEGVYELKDLHFYHNFIPTASVLFKRFEMPNWFNNLPYGDLAVYSIVAKNQKIKCLDFVGSVYRIHDKGLWQGKSRRNQVLMGLKFNKKIYSHVDSEIQKIIKLKSIVLMEEVIKIEYKNRFFRGVYFRYLKYIYFPN